MDSENQPETGTRNETLDSNAYKYEIDNLENTLTETCDLMQRLRGQVQRLKVDLITAVLDGPQLHAIAEAQRICDEAERQLSAEQAQ